MAYFKRAEFWHRTGYDLVRLVVSFGPDHAPLEQRQVALAIEEAQSLFGR